MVTALTFIQSHISILKLIYWSAKKAVSIKSLRSVVEFSLHFKLKTTTQLMGIQIIRYIMTVYEYFYSKLFDIIFIYSNCVYNYYNFLVELNFIYELNLIYKVTNYYCVIISIISNNCRTCERSLFY